MPRSAHPIIVVIDDDEDAIFLFKHWMKNAGVRHPIMPIVNGEEAIRYFDRVAGSNGRATAPAICFLDIKMPGRNGFEVLSAIRSHEALDDMPVVMLSSSADRRDLAKAAHLGAQCYLLKSVSSELMGEAFRQTLAHATERRKTRSPFPIRTNLLLNTD